MSLSDGTPVNRRDQGVYELLDAIKATGIGTAGITRPIEAACSLLKAQARPKQHARRVIRMLAAEAKKGGE